MLFKKQNKVGSTNDNRLEISVIDKTNLSAPQTPWRSITIVSAFTFCTAAQFTLYFSSLWPFLQIIDSTASETFYGLIIAIYSFGQLLSGPVVGFWATKTRSIVSPCQFCLMLTLIGNIVYVAASVMPSHQKWWILAGRFFVGMGESSLSLYQGFASTASTHKDRSKALSITTGGLALGFTFGPALQLLFTPLKYPGYNIFGKLYINMYTSPAIACCIINIFCIIGLKVLFVETYAGLANPNATSKEEKKIHVPKYDRIGVALCHVTRFVQLFAFTNLETIGTPFVMALFALNSEKTVQSLSVAHSISGALGFAAYMFHAFHKTELIDWRLLCILGFSGILAFHVFTIPLPFNVGQLTTYSSAEYGAFKRSNNTLPEPVGCPKDVFSWCETTGTVNFWVYMILMTFVLGLFWPNLNISLSTILSKVLGPRRQSNQQSIFQMSASAARLCGPLIISNIYSSYGPMYSWLLEIVVLILIILLWIVQYKRFVPLVMPEQSPPVDFDEIEEIEKEEAQSFAARF